MARVMLDSEGEATDQRPAAGRSARLGPRGEARRTAIEDAARAVFLEKGYERATLNEILARSRGSRSTFYEIYGSKEGLFRAMLEAMTGGIGARLNAATESDGPPRVVLVRYGLLLLDALLAPETQGILRILVAEGRLFPDLASDFFRMGPDSTRAWLAAYITRMAAPEGWRLGHDPVALADLLLSMIVIHQSSHPLICPQRALPPEERAAHVERAVDLFLRAVGG